MSFLSHPLTLTTLAHTLIVCAIGVRVIKRRTAPGVAFAWLFLAGMLPIVGALLYVLIGERRVGPERTRRLAALADRPGGSDYAGAWPEQAPVDWSRHSPAGADLDRIGRSLCGWPTVGGSRIALHTDSESALQSIARDIDGARRALSMTFFIWDEGGSADEVLEAVIRASDRGVACRVLVDAIGARRWLKGRQPERLRVAGVRVEAALPPGPLRLLVRRIGTRLHRKAIVIDDAVAWTGSMNLADPRIFKRAAGVGQWVDAMIRARGAVVAPIGATVLGDWMLETGARIDELARATGHLDVEPEGETAIQVVPTGPGESGDGLLQMLLALVGSARDEVVLTTPYLVPDESMILALRGAAARGVRVTIVVPARVDSRLTGYASQSYFDELLEAGVVIQLYDRGLLHTKSIVVDGSMAMFGSVNLDMRSLWLNYEIALFVYDTGFAGELRAVQDAYIADSAQLEAGAWARRSALRRLREDVCRLVSPIL